MLATKLCATCEGTRYEYLGTLLPCARPSCSPNQGDTCQIAVRRESNPGFTVKEHLGRVGPAYVRVVFERARDMAFGWRWKPVPCIDATTDAILTNLLQDAGLSEALIYPHTREQQARTESMRATAIAKEARERLVAEEQKTAALRSRIAELQKELADEPRVSKEGEALKLALAAGVGSLPGRAKSEPWIPSVDDFDLLPDV